MKVPFVAALMALVLLAVGAPAVAEADDGISFTYKEAVDPLDETCPELEVRRDGEIVITLDGGEGQEMFSPCSKEMVTVDHVTRVDGRVYFAWGASPYSYIMCHSSLGGCITYTGFNQGIWVTDGTAAGTVRLSQRDGYSACKRHWLVGDTSLYFAAGCSSWGWLQDGRLAAGFGLRGDPKRFRVLGDRLMYTSADRTHGRELWRVTDGRRALVKDIRPGPRKSFIQRMVVRDGRLWFLADDGNGLAQWVSDGTRNGTRKVR
jgi:ELWxxDGT repeat protein